MEDFAVAAELLALLVRSFHRRQHDLPLGSCNSDRISFCSFRLFPLSVSIGINNVVSCLLNSIKY